MTQERLDYFVSQHPELFSQYRELVHCTTSLLCVKFHLVDIAYKDRIKARHQQYNQERIALDLHRDEMLQHDEEQHDSAEEAARLLAHEKIDRVNAVRDRSVAGYKMDMEESLRELLWDRLARENCCRELGLAVDSEEDEKQETARQHIKARFETLTAPDRVLADLSTCQILTDFREAAASRKQKQIELRKRLAGDRRTTLKHRRASRDADIVVLREKRGSEINQLAALEERLTAERLSALETFLDGTHGKAGAADQSAQAVSVEETFAQFLSTAIQSCKDDLASL